MALIYPDQTIQQNIDAIGDNVLTRHGKEMRKRLHDVAEQLYTGIDSAKVQAEAAAQAALDAAEEASQYGDAVEKVDGIADRLDAEMVASYKARVTRSISLTNAGVAPSSGANTAGAQYYRTGYTTIDRTYLFVPPAGYKVLIWVYRSTSVSSAVMSPTGKAYTGDPVIIEKADGVNYARISYLRDDGEDMNTDPDDDTSDYSIIMSSFALYAKVDKNLDTDGASADAGVVGRKFSDIESVIGKAVYNPSGSSSETESGLSYSSVNGTATIIGTATAKYFHNLQGGASSIPSWVEKGKEYFVTLVETGTKNIKLNITGYVDGDPVTLFSSVENGTFTVPNTINGMIIRYYVPKGAEVNATIHPRITDRPTLDMLMDAVRKMARTPIKVRMMQNNIGKLNRGQPLDGTAQYLTTANKDDIILAYRNLYGNYQPDIIGIEEWVKTREVRDAEDKTQTVETINTDDLIFDRLYPQKRESVGLSSALAIKSKFPIMSGSKMERIDFDYEWEGVSKNDHFYVLTAHVDIGRRDVMIGVTPFVSAGGENVEKRKAAMPIVLGLFEEADYAFLICDANHAGNRGDTPGESWEPSAIEGNWLYENIIHPMGFNTVHGSYFPWQMTWESVNTGHRGCVDNIYYKDNGKVVFDGMKVLGEEFSSLLSDHVPVIADFTLL